MKYLEKNLKIAKSPEEIYYLGENLAIGALVITKKLKNSKNGKIQKYKKIGK